MLVRSIWARLIGQQCICNQMIIFTWLKKLQDFEIFSSNLLGRLICASFAWSGVIGTHLNDVLCSSFGDEQQIQKLNNFLVACVSVQHKFFPWT
jgi:hypothetical protein